MHNFIAPDSMLWHSETFTTFNKEKQGPWSRGVGTCPSKKHVFVPPPPNIGSLTVPPLISKLLRGPWGCWSLGACKSFGIWGLIKLLGLRTDDLPEVRTDIGGLNKK